MVEQASNPIPPTLEPNEPKEDSNSVLDKAEALAKRIEAANKRTEELLNRQEKISAKVMLSGRAEAGGPVKTPKDMEQEEIKKRVEDTLRRYKRLPNPN